jgi:hypothetical protein
VVAGTGCPQRRRPHDLGLLTERGKDDLGVADGRLRVSAQ